MGQFETTLPPIPIVSKFVSFDGSFILFCALDAMKDRYDRYSIEMTAVGSNTLFCISLCGV